MTENKTFSHKEAARYLGVASQTLHNWRHSRKGPNYIKLGSKVIYRLVDLDAYLESRRVVLEA
jgi:predicted site-specific integrase-resolvase